MSISLNGEEVVLEDAVDDIFGSLQEFLTNLGKNADLVCACDHPLYKRLEKADSVIDDIKSMGCLFKDLKTVVKQVCKPEDADEKQAMKDFIDMNASDTNDEPMGTTREKLQHVLNFMHCNMRELCMCIDQDADYDIMLAKSKEINENINTMGDLFKDMKADMKQKCKPMTPDERKILTAYTDERLEKQMRKTAITD
jgi:hypothetical protein